MEHSRNRKSIYIIDLSVLLFDPRALQEFGRHFLLLPSILLEQLDEMRHNLSEHDDRGFMVREVQRLIDRLSKKAKDFSEWILVQNEKKGKFMIVHTPDRTGKKIDACYQFEGTISEHRILNLALETQEQFPQRRIIIVSKDIGLRIKAKALGLRAQDYEKGKVNVAKLNKGVTSQTGVTSDVIMRLLEGGSCEPEEVGLDHPLPNGYYKLCNGNKSCQVRYNLESRLLESVVLQRTVSGIKPLNEEQAVALDAILEPSIQLVTLQGVAGTGKTLLALAGALQQKRDFWQIYLARPIVPLSNRDIGFLPGDIKSKINPYMEPLWDNLKFIQSQFPDNSKEVKQIQQMVDQEKLMITPLAYIRGRSLSNIFFIIDEAQNLTPHEVKTIITRAGKGTKIVFTGDIFQIDTPYLDAQSNGLSYLIEKAKGHPLYAHVTLAKGERSELANIANQLL
jgi:PhoH-like ATPase